MTSGNLAIIARPITRDREAFLVLQENESLIEHNLRKNTPISFTITDKTKYCTGWYDIATHTNYICEKHARVESAYDSCFACRKKTDFHPAFYNSSEISEKQSTYNNLPHSVYIAYFGNGLAKAGIMSDSRRQERLYEQGALLYVIVASYPNAYIAHDLENRLIEQGLKNSISKKQKSAVYEKVVDLATEEHAFQVIINGLGYENLKIVSNNDMFFFGEYQKVPIKLLECAHVSGTIRGIIGSYIVLENNERLYGYWLPNLYGYYVTIGTEIVPIARAPEQVSLF